MELHQTKELLHNKGSNQQRDNLQFRRKYLQLYFSQEVNNQTIQGIHTTPYEKQK